jgi:O-antigen/teichoic acid export membrane protein
MSVTMVVSFLLLPFLLRHIGKPAYGLQALAHQTLEFVTILAFAVGMSYNRIAAGYYAQGKYDRMNAVLSAGLILSVLVALTIAAATVLLAIFAHVLFDLPLHLILPAKRVLIIFGAGSAIHIISSVYASSIYITQRLYLKSISSAVGVLVPAAIIIPLFVYWRASIVVWVGLSVAVRLLALWAIVIPFGRRGISEIRIRLFAPGARREMKELAQFGGLTVFGSLGALLYYATDSIMISNLNELGIQQVVNYNVAQRWFPQISMFASSFVLIMGPTMIAKVAVGQLDTLRSMVARATRYCFIILACPCLLLFIQAEDFLRLWLKSAFVMESVPVMRIIMCALLMSGAGIVSKEALYANRKIRGAVLATLCGGGLNIVLSITLVKVAGMGLLGIATGSLISLFLLEVICHPYLLCKHISLGYGVFVRGAMRALLGAVPLVGACLLLRQIWTPTNLPEIVAQFFVCGLAYLPSIWFVSLTQTDRKDLKAMLAAAIVTWRERHAHTADQPTTEGSEEG